MYRFLKVTAVFMLFGALFFSCRKDEFDKFYGRPAGLSKPIYQQLDSMGNFKSFLVCIDKSGYKQTLSAAGSWTIFAPTDEAFAVYLQESGVNNVSALDDETAKSIVRYSMIYDGEKLNKLNDFFSNKGFIPGLAFRRKTLYYDFVEDEQNNSGKAIKIIGSNRNGTYLSTDFNNKNIPFYFTSYMSLRNLGASDYNSLYPNSNYTGLNVGGANILANKNDIPAENGVIHVVDKVLTPPKNIDQYLRGNPDYTEFRNILQKFVTYSYNSDVTHKYQVLTGKTDSVFTKLYQLNLAFSPNNENYLREDPNDAQTNNYSITVPTNKAVRDYAQKVLLKYYPRGTTLSDLYQLNGDILKDYINGHMYTTQLWPSKFSLEATALNESTKLNKATDINEIKNLSNGVFYGVKASQRPNVFETVYGNLYLDPKFSIMRRAIELEGYNLTLKIPTLRYVFILISDKVLGAMGFSYDSYFPAAPIRYNGLDGRVTLRRIMQQHIIPIGNRPVPDFSGEGILESYNGEYIKYKSNRLISAGTLDSVDVAKRSIAIDSSYAGASNGLVLYSKGVLSFSGKTIGQRLLDLGANLTTSPYNKFYTYLLADNIDYTSATGEISGVSLGLNYTLFIPNNAAMTAAVTAGLLPATPSSDVDKVSKFIKYHIIKNAIAIDGLKNGTYETLFKDADGVINTITVSNNSKTGLSVKGNKGNTATTDLINSNVLSDRKLIHSINTFLDYRIN